MSDTPAPTSAALYERAVRVMPGGNSRTTLYRSPHQIYAARGDGAWVTDVDGVRRLDVVNNYTSLIHGHAHPAVVAAAQAAVAAGSCFGMATAAEVELAERLHARQPEMERVRFANSGAEAVMLAIKAARAFTGRPKIAKFEGAFHGIADFAEISTDSVPDNWGVRTRPASVAASSGSPAGVAADVIVLPFNDAAATVELIEEHADTLAGVIIDPLPNRIGFIPATASFLTAVRDACTHNGALLISDEVMSYRLALGGAQERFGYRPDLVALGKIIGGGFPVGAVGGSEAAMSVFDPSRGKPKVPHGGTFNANPVTMCAGAVTLDLYDKAAIARLHEMGESLRPRLAAALAGAGLDWQVSGLGSLMRIVPTAARLTDYRSSRPDAASSALFTAFTRALFDRGILTDAAGLISLSTAMTAADLDLLVATVAETAATVAEGR